MSSSLPFEQFESHRKASGRTSGGIKTHLHCQAECESGKHFFSLSPFVTFEHCVPRRSEFGIHMQLSASVPDSDLYHGLFLKGL